MLLTRIKSVADILSTILVTLAAGFVLVTQVESRWFRSQQRDQPQDVNGLTIEATTVRHTRGTGDIALVEFTDYECPFCGQHARNTVPNIDSEFVDTGQVRHIVFNFPLERIHPKARKAGEAAECAGQQGLYWQMYRHLFANQHSLQEQALIDSAHALGIEPATFARCLAGAMADRITADLKEGRRLGVTSTPTLFIGKVQPDGSIRLTKRVSGAVPITDLRDLIKSMTAATVARN